MRSAPETYQVFIESIQMSTTAVSPRFLDPTSCPVQICFMPTVPPPSALYLPYSSFLYKHAALMTCIRMCSDINLYNPCIPDAKTSAFPDTFEKLLGSMLLQKFSAESEHHLPQTWYAQRLNCKLQFAAAPKSFAARRDLVFLGLWVLQRGLPDHQRNASALCSCADSPFTEDGRSHIDYVRPETWSRPCS